MLTCVMMFMMMTVMVMITMITIRRGLRRQHGVQLAHLPRPDHHRRQPRRDRLRRLQERGHPECLRLLPSELCEYIHGWPAQKKSLSSYLWGCSLPFWHRMLPWDFF